MTPEDAARRERAFVLYHVEGKGVAAVARELGTSAASVIRWARSFEQREPVRAEQLRRGVTTEAPAGFMAQVRARVEGARQVAAVEMGKALGLDMPPADDTADAADDEELDDLSNESLLEFVKKQIRDARAMAETSEKREHIMRTIAGMLPVLDRLEKRMRDGNDTLHVPRAEIDAAISDITQNFEAVCDQPFTCAECGRAVRRRKAEAAEKAQRACGELDEDDGDDE